MGKNLHKGYYGQYSGNSKFSKRHDEDYDAKEAYNKNLTASARLHYLENLRHDHDSPAKNIDPREDKSSYEYDEDFAADKEAERKAKKAAKDAAAKMSALPKKFNRTAEDIERRQRERLEKEAAKKKQKK